MRTLYLIRHAKSSWKDMSLSDFDRPLNKRGIRDAPIMAQWLLENIDGLDAIISSPATRAKSTALEFANLFGVKIEFHKSLYHAAEAEIFSSVYSVKDKYQSIALFGHNPGFTYFANEFTGSQYIDNVPTCGIVAIQSSAKSWTDFSTSNSSLKFFMYPKKLQES